MIKFVMTVLLLLPNGDARVIKMDETTFDSYEDCVAVGKAIKYTKREVIAFECTAYTEV